MQQGWPQTLQLSHFIGGETEAWAALHLQFHSWWGTQRRCRDILPPDLCGRGQAQDARSHCNFFTFPPLAEQKAGWVLLSATRWAVCWERRHSDGAAMKLCSYTRRGFPGRSGGEESACNAGSIPGLGRSPGEENGSPLQYSCLENPMDRGAWWVTVHGATMSPSQLND